MDNICYNKHVVKNFNNTFSINCLGSSGELLNEGEFKVKLSVDNQYPKTVDINTNITLPTNKIGKHTVTISWGNKTYVNYKKTITYYVHDNFSFKFVPKGQLSNIYDFDEDEYANVGDIFKMDSIVISPSDNRTSLDGLDVKIYINSKYYKTSTVKNNEITIYCLNDEVIHWTCDYEICYFEWNYYRLKNEWSENDTEFIKNVEEVLNKSESFKQEIIDKIDDETKKYNITIKYVLNNKNYSKNMVLSYNKTNIKNVKNGVNKISKNILESLKNGDIKKLRDFETDSLEDSYINRIIYIKN